MNVSHAPTSGDEIPPAILEMMEEIAASAVKRRMPGRDLTAVGLRLILFIAENSIKPVEVLNTCIAVLEKAKANMPNPNQ